MFCNASIAQIRDYTNYTRKASEKIFALKTEESIKEAVQKLEESNYNKSMRSDLGVDRECFFNALPGFQVTKTVRPDPFHDVCEGIIISDLYLFLEDLFPPKQNGSRDLDQRKDFQERLEEMKGWKYNKVNINWKTKEINGSGSGVKELFHRFPEFFKDGWEGLESWKMYIKLREISSVVYSEKYTMKDIETMKLNIEQYFKGMQLFMQSSQEKDYHIFPKTHLIYHYPMFLEQFGPLAKFDTIRNERMQKFMKDQMKSSNCYKNIPWTVAQKIQTHRAVVLMNDSEKLVRTKEKIVRGTDYPNYDLRHISNDLEGVYLFSSSSININYTTFSKFDMRKLKTGGDLPTYVQIDNIISSDEKFMLMCYVFKAVSFVKHLHSYRLEPQAGIQVFSSHEFDDHEHVMIFNIELPKNHFTYYAHKTRVHVIMS